METRVASCHCQSLLIRCDGRPKKISMCHCLDCQRRTGSAFSVAVFYDRSNVHIEQGKTKTFLRHSVSGFPVTFHFCSDCGSNVFWEPTRLRDLIGVAMGAFADPNFAQPEQAVFTKHKHAWVELPTSVILFEENPPIHQRQ
jgi:hypothetical protein